jgi:hypothetical protein
MTPHGFGWRCMYSDYIDYVLRFGAISMPMRLGQCRQRLAEFTGLSGKKFWPLEKNYDPKKFSLWYINIMLAILLKIIIYWKLICKIALKNRPLLFVLPFLGYAAELSAIWQHYLGLSVSTRLIYK